MEAVYTIPTLSWILVLNFVLITTLIAVYQAREKSAFRAIYEAILLVIAVLGLLNKYGYSFGIDYREQLNIMTFYPFFYWLFVWRRFTRRLLAPLSYLFIIILGIFMWSYIMRTAAGFQDFPEPLPDSETVRCILFFEFLYAPLLAGVSMRIARRFQRTQ